MQKVEGCGAPTYIHYKNSLLQRLSLLANQDKSNENTIFVNPVQSYFSSLPTAQNLSFVGWGEEDEERFQNSFSLCIVVFN